MNQLEDIAYQLKEMNKTLGNIYDELSDLTEINEHLGTLTTHMSSIDDTLEIVVGWMKTKKIIP